MPQITAEEFLRRKRNVTAEEFLRRKRETRPDQTQPAEQPPGFFQRLGSNIKTGAEQAGQSFRESEDAGLEVLGAAFRGDIRPAREIGEIALRSAGQFLMGGNPSFAALSKSNEAAIARAQAERQARRATETADPKFQEQLRRTAQQGAEIEARAAADPSLAGKITRGIVSTGLRAAPEIIAGLATGGSLSAVAATAALTSLGQPETLPLTVGLSVAPIPAGEAFRAGVNSVRRTFGKGAAQVIEAEAMPAAVAQVRQTIPEAPGVLPAAAEAPAPVISPSVDPLPTVFAKLGTDNIEQIGAMFANANRRLKKKDFTPEQRASAVADYNALKQLTREEHDALSQVLPGRQFHPAEREIMDIPTSERNAQLDANLREAEAFFGAEGRTLQAAEDAAIIGDVGPGAMAGQFGGRAAAVAPRIEAEMALPSLSADMSLPVPSVRAAASVTGPRVGADLEALNVAPAGQAVPPVPPSNVPTGFGGAAPRGQQQLFDAAARSPWQDTALAYFRANLLTNPAGRALDLGSTVINQFADAAARPVAAAVDVIVSKLTGQRSITWSPRGSGQAFGSIRQGLRDAREVLRTGNQVIDSGADDVLYGREIRSGLGKVADVPVNGLFRLLGAMDAPFRRFAFARNLQDRARVAAINEAKRGRIPQDQTVTRARELIDRDDIIAAAVRDGEKAVLSESNLISSWVTAQTRNSPNARLAFGLLQPFVRIPLNAVFKAADFAGIGGVKALFKLARGGVRKAKGQSFFRDLEEQRIFSQNVAAGSFGVAGFMLGMELEERGKLEGYFYTGRRDFPGRRSPTSIDIGGTRYDIQRLGGFITAPLFIGATYNRLRKEDVGKANALLRSFGGLIQQAPALGYYGAPAKAGRVLSADDMTGELAKEAGNVASGFLPASGALGATAKALDTVKKREAEGFTGPIMSKIPGLREQLPATGNDAIDAAVERNSPLLVELQRLGVRIAELQRKKDEPDDKFNARVQQFGQNYTSYGLRLIQDSRFRAASDDVKARALKRLNEKAKGLTHKEFTFPEVELDPGLILDSVEK